MSILSESAASISWETREPATSQLEYGVTMDYGLLTPLDEKLITSHSVTLSHLEPDSTYHFRVKSRNEAGKEAVSDDYTFTVTTGTARRVKLFGYVTDEEGIVLEKHYVTVHDNNHVWLANTQTDENGYYQLIVPYHELYKLYVEKMFWGSWDITNYVNPSKAVSVGQFDEVRADFKLKHYANIIIHAYDNDGDLLLLKDFSELSDVRVYATDLNDIPYYGSPGSSSVHSAIFQVAAQTPYRIHVLWEVPEFGKIMLSADNEGKGYSVDGPGGEIVLNFNHEAAKSKLAMFQRDYNLFQNQGYSISASVGEELTLSKEHLKLAEGYLTQTPSPDMKSAVAELNLSLKHSLWAHEQLHLDRAEADIERYRKGDVKIIVVDEKGKPLGDFGISLTQTSHDFLFATSHCYPPYSDLLKQAGINCIYMYLEYGIIEPEPGRFEWSSDDSEVNYLLDEGFNLIGHTDWLFFRCPYKEPTYMDCPRYLDDMSFEEIKENVYRHMYTVADRYKGRIDIWEPICEPCVFNQYNWTWNQKFEIYRIAASAIKDAIPEARILPWNPSLPYELSPFYKPDIDLDERAEGVPFGNMVEGMPFPVFIKHAIEKEVPIDIIGLFIVSGVYVHTTPERIHLALDLASLSVLVDQYSSFGKPIFFREHQAPSTQVAGSCWWHRPWDEQTQAEYVEQFYTLMFSKPLMEGIGWSTGITDDLTEKLGILSGGLLDADFKPKPAYFTLKNLINSWKTTGTGVTDENGEFQLRGFAGDYDITLVSPDGRSYGTKLHILEQEYAEFTICIGEDAECIVLPSTNE